SAARASQTSEISCSPRSVWRTMPAAKPWLVLSFRPRTRKGPGPKTASQPQRRASWGLRHRTFWPGRGNSGMSFGAGGGVIASPPSNMDFSSQAEMSGRGHSRADAERLQDAPGGGRGGAGPRQHLSLQVFPDRPHLRVVVNRLPDLLLDQRPEPAEVLPLPPPRQLAPRRQLGVSPLDRVPDLFHPVAVQGAARQHRTRI